jgi:hypothetical protein
VRRNRIIFQCLIPDDGKDKALEIYRKEHNNITATPGWRNGRCMYKHRLHKKVVLLCDSSEKRSTHPQAQIKLAHDTAHSLASTVAPNAPSSISLFRSSSLTPNSRKTSSVCRPGLRYRLFFIAVEVWGKDCRD